MNLVKSVVLLLSINFSATYYAYARTYTCKNGHETVGTATLSNLAYYEKESTLTCTEYIASGYSDSYGFCSKSEYVIKEVAIIKAKYNFLFSKDIFTEHVLLKKILDQHYSLFLASLIIPTLPNDTEYSFSYDQLKNELIVRQYQILPNVEFGQPRWKSNSFNCIENQSLTFDY